MRGPSFSSEKSEGFEEVGGVYSVCMVLGGRSPLLTSKSPLVTGRHVDAKGRPGVRKHDLKI